MGWRRIITSCGSRQRRHYKMNRGDFDGLLGFLWPGLSQVCYSNAMDRKSFHSRCKAALFCSCAFLFTSTPFLNKSILILRKSTLLRRKSTTCQSFASVGWCQLFHGKAVCLLCCSFNSASPLLAAVLFRFQATDFCSGASGSIAVPTRFFSLLLRSRSYPRNALPSLR